MDRARSDDETMGQLERSVQQLEVAAVRQLALLRARVTLSDDELFALLLIADEGEVTIAALSKLTGLSRSGTGALVQRLEQAGLVDRSGDPVDRRVRRVTLSQAAHAQLAAARAGVTERLASTLGDLPLVDLRRLRNLTERFAAAVGSTSVAEAAQAVSGRPEPVWRRWA